MSGTSRGDAFKRKNTARHSDDAGRNAREIFKLFVEKGIEHRALANIMNYSMIFSRSRARWSRILRFILFKRGEKMLKTLVTALYVYSPIASLEETRVSHFSRHVVLVIPI